MTKDEFNKLNIHEKVEYINSNIDKFGSAHNVCKHIGVNIDTFRGNIKNIYTYVPYYQRYVRIADLNTGLKWVNEDSNNSLMVIDDSKHSQSIPVSTGLTEVENAQEKLVSLLNNYDKILNLIENAQEHSQSFYSNNSAFMDLNMPNNNQLKKTTIRVNEQIWEEFKKCIDTEFNHLEQYDMISVALRDFINKYSLQNKKDV